VRKRIVAGAVAICAAGFLLIQGGEGTGPIQQRPDGLWFCAYPDPATKNDPIKRGAPWTIGYGHTGPEVHKGLCIPEKQANALLIEDIGKAQSALARCVSAPVHENELGGMLSLTLNAGGPTICGSTLVKKVNRGDYVGAADEFPKWIYANRKIMPGLVKRRACERQLFMTVPTDTNRDKTVAVVKGCIMKGAA
jgi:lysozyme